MVDAKRFEIEDMAIGRDPIPGAPVTPIDVTKIPSAFGQSCEQYMNQFKMQRITVAKFEGVEEGKWGMRMDPKTAVIIMVHDGGIAEESGIQVGDRVDIAYMPDGSVKYFTDICSGPDKNQWAQVISSCKKVTLQRIVVNFQSTIEVPKGVGAKMGCNMEANMLSTYGWLVVSEVPPNTMAAKSGILPGDRIVQCDDGDDDEDEFEMLHETVGDKDFGKSDKFALIIRSNRVTFERPGGPSLRKGGEDKAKKVKTGMFASGFNMVKKGVKTTVSVAGNIEKKLTGKNKFCQSIIKKIGTDDLERYPWLTQKIENGLVAAFNANCELSTPDGPALSKTNFIQLYRRFLQACLKEGFCQDKDLDGLEQVHAAGDKGGDGNIQYAEFRQIIYATFNTFKKDSGDKVSKANEDGIYQTLDVLNLGNSC